MVPRSRKDVRSSGRLHTWQDMRGVIRFIRHPWRTAPRVSCAGLLACSGCSDPLGMFDDEATVWISATGVLLEPGDTMRFAVTLEVGDDIHRMPEAPGFSWPSDLSISWASSDPAVVSIDAGGLAMAHAPGRVTIRLEVDGAHDSATVGVRPVPGVDPVFYQVIAAGGVHTCGLSLSNDAYCWGSSWYGETGTGASRPYVSIASPALAGKDMSFSAVSVGNVHSCALTPAGKAFCWGNGEYGQLGNGRASPSYFTGRPEPVQGDLAFRSIAAGNFHTCAVTTAGEAYCWGGARSSAPVRVSATLKFASISVGGHSCGIAADRRAYCWWGTNEFGQLGDGTTTASDTPVAVAGDLTFQSLDAGSQHTCGVTTQERAYCWGNNWRGRLGTGSETPSAVPQPVDTEITFVSVSAGGEHTCALRVDGSAYCWGSNWRGQLGNDFPIGDEEYTAIDYQELSPVSVVGHHAFVLLSAGAEGHTCGVTQSGAALCWGSNSHGQLGYGRLDFFPGTELRIQTVPVAVASAF